jgi:hypothetical protein
MTGRGKVVVLTGVFVGTTDILAAIISQYIKTGKFPDKMFNYMGGGLIGLERSMNGGNWGAFLGVFNHYAICLTFTLFFFLILPRLKFLHYNRYLIGMLYGVFVSLTMRYIVIPLTPLPPGREFVFMEAFMGWLTLGIVLGIPIVFNAYRYYRVDDRLF